MISECMSGKSLPAFKNKFGTEYSKSFQFEEHKDGISNSSTYSLSRDIDLA
jgi:hypothetical protein